MISRSSLIGHIVEVWLRVIVGSGSVAAIVNVIGVSSLSFDMVKVITTYFGVVRFFRSFEREIFEQSVLQSPTVKIPVGLKLIAFTVKLLGLLVMSYVISSFFKNIWNIKFKEKILKLLYLFFVIKKKVK